MIRRYLINADRPVEVHASVTLAVTIVALAKRCHTPALLIDVTGSINLDQLQAFVIRRAEETGFALAVIEALQFDGRGGNGGMNITRRRGRIPGTGGYCDHDRLIRDLINFIQ